MESGVSQLDREIAGKASEVAAKERELEFARLELKTLRHAAALVRVNGTHHAQTQTPEDPPKEEGTGRGKLAGTLSNRWRKVMSVVAETGNDPMPPNGWVAAGEIAGFELSLSATAQWLRRGVGAKMGFIEKVGGDEYRVSQTAIEKFGFKTAKPSPGGSGNGSA